MIVRYNCEFVYGILKPFCSRSTSKNLFVVDMVLGSDICGDDHETFGSVVRESAYQCRDGLRGSQVRGGMGELFIGETKNREQQVVKRR